MCCSASTGNKIFGILTLIVAITLTASSGRVCNKWYEAKQNIGLKVLNEVVRVFDKALNTNMSQLGEALMNDVIAYSAIACAAGVLQILASILAIVAAFEGKKNRVASCCSGFILAIGFLAVISILGLLFGGHRMTEDDVNILGSSFKNWVIIMVVDIVYLFFGSCLIACLSRREDEDTQRV